MRKKFINNNKDISRMKLGRKAFVFRIINLVIVIIAIILLVFLIRNDWDIGTAIGQFIEFFGR